MPTTYDLREFDVPNGAHPHDVSPAPDGGVWYTAQDSGELGWLDPKTGRPIINKEALYTTTQPAVISPASGGAATSTTSAGTALDTD